MIPARTARRLAAAALGAATLALVPAGAVAADTDQPPARPAAPGTDQSMSRMSEQMEQGNPGMARMHELMTAGNPGMARMHQNMMGG